MNVRLLICIAMGVFVIHIGVVMLLAHFRPTPHYNLPPTPNFSVKSATVIDPKTGEKTVYREITVSTKFAPAQPSPPPVQPHVDAPNLDSPTRDADAKNEDGMDLRNAAPLPAVKSS